MTEIHNTQALLRNAQLALCIIGRASAYELMEPDDVPAHLLLEGDSQTPGDRRFVGVLAIVDGNPQSSLLEPIEEPEIKLLSDIFARYVAFVIGQRIAAMPCANDRVH